MAQQLQSEGSEVELNLGEGGMTIHDLSACRERSALALRPVSQMLDNGRCEPLKAAVHGVLFATASLCAAYNAAAWIKRRQPHLAINAVVYTLAACWERCHVAHHRRACAKLIVRAEPARAKPLEAAPETLTDAA